MALTLFRVLLTLLNHIVQSGKYPMSLGTYTVSKKNLLPFKNNNRAKMEKLDESKPSK